MEIIKCLFPLSDELFISRVIRCFRNMYGIRRSRPPAFCPLFFIGRARFIRLNFSLCPIAASRNLCGFYFRGARAGTKRDAPARCQLKCAKGGGGKPLRAAIHSGELFLWIFGPVLFDRERLEGKYPCKRWNINCYTRWPTFTQYWKYYLH